MTVLVRRYATAVAIVVAIGLGITTYSRSRVYRSSEKIWTDAAAKRPNNPRAYGNLGQLAMRGGPARYAEAWDWFARALAADSTDAPALEHLAWIAERTERPDDARRLVERTLHFHPNDLWALRAHGNLLVSSGKVDDGIVDLERAAQIGRTDSLLVDLGTAYMAVGRTNDAVRSLADAIAIDPNRTDAMRFLGSALTEAGRPAEAVEQLSRAAEREPAAGLNHALLSAALADLGRADEAARAAQAAAECPDATALVYRIAGRAMLDVERLEEAERYLGMAAGLQRDAPGILSELADAKAGLGKFGEAAALYRKALTIQPGYGPALRGIEQLRK